MGPAEVAAILTPVLLPFLRRAGSQAREKIAARLGSEAARSVGVLWDRMRERITGIDPAETDGEMESRIADVLQDDPALLREARITATLVVEGEHNTVQQGGTNINISGGQNIQIGRLSD